jgi:hypothetical protein
MGDVEQVPACPGQDGVSDPAPAQPRYGRRLSDKVLAAFHQACDQSDLELAEDLLRVLEKIVTERSFPPEANRRRSIESLVAAHERLWHLRHPEAKEA